MRLVDKIIATDLQNSPDFILADLLFHTHRINVLGMNSINNYWHLSKTPPSEVNYIINKEQFRKFAEVYLHHCLYFLENEIMILFKMFTILF